MANAADSDSKVVDLSDLNPEFRRRMGNFLTAASAAGIPAHIIEAYRSNAVQAQYYAEKQQGLRPYPVAPPGSSFHNYGYAADTLADDRSRQQALIDFANQHPDLGIAPLPGDAPHFQIAGYKHVSDLLANPPAYGGGAQPDLTPFIAAKQGYSIAPGYTPGLTGGGTPNVDARVASTANTASLSPPSRPSSPTPGVTLNSPMDLVARVESGNRNIPQAIHDKNTDRGTPAGGYFQIIDPTWQRYAGAAGVDVKQYPNAMSAPRDVQAKVASAIPVNQWGPNTVAALKTQYPNIDTSQTLGQVQSAALGSTPATPAAAPVAGVLPGFGDKASSDNFTQGAKALDKGMMHGGDSGQEGQAAAFNFPQARNVSPLLPMSNQIYGNTLTSMATPTQWGSATPGQNPYAAAGGAPIGGAFGTQLGSMQQLQQMMAMMGNPYGDAGYG